MGVEFIVECEVELFEVVDIEILIGGFVEWFVFVEMFGVEVYCEVDEEIGFFVGEVEVVGVVILVDEGNVFVGLGWVGGFVIEEGDVGYDFDVVEGFW